MKKENAYNLMDQLLTIEYDLDSMIYISTLLLRTLQENPSEPLSHLLTCYLTLMQNMQQKLRASISLLDESILL